MQAQELTDERGFVWCVIEQETHRTSIQDGFGNILGAVSYAGIREGKTAYQAKILLLFECGFNGCVDAKKFWEEFFAAHELVSVKIFGFSQDYPWWDVEIDAKSRYGLRDDAVGISRLIGDFIDDAIKAFRRKLDESFKKSSMDDEWNGFDREENVEYE